MDWGLARTGATRELASRDAVTTSIEDSEGVVSGTPSFMAPEQARGEAIDERVDVFAVGALLLLRARPEAPLLGSERHRDPGPRRAGAADPAGGGGPGPFRPICAAS